MSLTASTLTPETADSWLRLAIHNIQQEYPHVGILVTQSDDDYVPHRQNHPTFFGSLDWHSCVEMYWVAARIMRVYPGLPAEKEALAVINDLLTADNIAKETAYCERNPGFERPYGWGWLLKLQEELDLLDTPETRQWRDALLPLADLFRSRFETWLPKLTYPQRIGMHTNTAFALMLSLPHITRVAPDLHDLVAARSQDWFLQDARYPFAYEPSGADFLSAGLTEAVLMRYVLDTDQFAAWIEAFLPATGSDWLTPASISDPTDGQIAHLHGLNLSRAWALGELAAVLPDRSAELTTLREAHIVASIDAVAGSHYMVEHWVVAYALLLHTEPA